MNRRQIPSPPVINNGQKRYIPDDVPVAEHIPSPPVKSNGQIRYIPDDTLESKSGSKGFGLFGKHESRWSSPAKTIWETDESRPLITFNRNGANDS